MKIEKINENQIRCTLTKDDLQDREIKISELAYGSEKAKSLFKDMMQQAAYEFGFEADDIPLMIEAVPLNAECIVLTITKVEDPEELDTRFAKFAPSVNTSEDSDDDYEDVDLNAFPSFSEALSKASDAPERTKDSISSKEPVEKAVPKEEPIKVPQTDGISSLLFSFSSLDSLIRLSLVLASVFHENSVVYKHPETGNYVLHLDRGSLSLSEFEKVFFTLSEYGTAIKNANITAANLEEHYEVLIAQQAIQKLAQMG